MAEFLARWNALGIKQRAAYAAAAAALVLATLAGSLLAHDDRVALYAAPLQPEQVAEVCERLAEWNVAFTATADNVRVGAGIRNGLLLRLSLDGVPHAHLASTADALAKAGPLEPQSVLDAQARAGLEGDIAASLRGIDGVSDARVIVAPAQSANYADERGSPASASVRLSLKPGVMLERSAIAGVRAYVAAAVPALEPAHVTLLDDRGAALGDDASGDEGPAFAASLQSALDAAFGAGATIVRARILYDPHSRERREVVRKPLGSRAIETTTHDERLTSASKRLTRTDASVDRGSDVTDERTEVPAGKVERLSVAVAVDEARGLDVAKIRSLAVGTLGLELARGDTLSVEAVPFAHPGIARAGFPWTALLGAIAALVPTLGTIVVVAVAARYGAQPLATVLEGLGRRLVAGRTTHAIAGYSPARVRGVLSGEPPHAAAAIISALPAATATAVLELYSPEERAAIVRRMARTAAPAVPDCETVLRRA